MTGLSDRFREVQVTLEQPEELPAGMPATWLNPEKSGVVVGFTYSRFERGRNRAEIQRLFTGVREVTARVMPLRAIMVAVFFQAEDGIRDTSVTGVQTCALPIYAPGAGIRTTRRFAYGTV